MSNQKLLIDRVEFATIKVEAIPGTVPRDDVFPQVAFDSSDLVFLVRSNLIYPPSELEDPRTFILSYGIKVGKDDSKDTPPYEIEVEACAYFRYVGGEEFSGADRFRAVRFSGYQILYGAIREMVSNLTARGVHGMWNLPARTFGLAAKNKADEDEAERQAAIVKKAEGTTLLAAPAKKVARKKSKAVKAAVRIGPQPD